MSLTPRRKHAPPHDRDRSFDVIKEIMSLILEYPMNYLNLQW